MGLTPQQLATPTWEIGTRSSRQLAMVLGHHQGLSVWKPRGGRHPAHGDGVAEEPYNHIRDILKALAPQSSPRNAMVVLGQQQGQI